MGLWRVGVDQGPSVGSATRTQQERVVLERVSGEGLSKPASCPGPSRLCCPSLPHVLEELPGPSTPS